MTSLEQKAREWRDAHWNEFDVNNPVPMLAAFAQHLGVEGNGEGLPVEHIDQALQGAMRELDTATMHSSPDSQFECMARAFKNIQFARTQLEQLLKTK